MMAKSNKKKKAKISYICKPNGMSLSEWQIALREQVATDEHFSIEAVNEKLEPGVYSVKNFMTKSEYKVVYRGAVSEWNYCSCMDFKTSQLGTCKHIEALKLWFCDKHRVHHETPPYSSVYVSYRNERKVCIRIGTDHHDEIMALSGKYFKKDGSLKETSYATFGTFLKAAKTIDDTFRCYQDAIDFVIDHRERKRREMMLKEYSDEKLDSLLTAKLFPYQKEGIRFATKAGKATIADEMGLGKTIQAIGTAEVLRKEGLVESVLILCPTSLKYQWKREIERFTHAQALVIEGNHLKRKQQYYAPEPYKIISYNSACNDIKIMGSLQTDMLIMDEVQRLKNWNTQISMAARRIKSQYSVVLSGTPFENKLEELYSVMEFVDQYCLAPYYKFRDNYIVTNETGKVMGYKNLNEIKKKLSDVLIRRRKRDVSLQMPERMDQNIFVPMTKEQHEIHNEFKMTVANLIHKWNRMHFLSEKDRKRLMLALSQMRMVCDSSYILDQKTRYDTKVDEVMNIIDSVLESEDEKVVVFSQWERMTRLVAKELDKRDIDYEYLHGGVPSVKRKDLVNNFTDLPESRVFLSTDAGSTGLNLQAAATIINLDLPWNPAVLEQRIARIYRIGQKKNIQVINLVTPDSIEEQMLGKLRFKSSMFEGALDGGDDTIFIDDNKFGQIVSTINDMVEESEEKEEETVSIDDSEPKAEEKTATEESIDKEIIEETMSEDKSETPKTSEEKPTEPTENPKELVAQGVSFFSGLAKTLKSKEATTQLIDRLVKTDEKTGETTINIPIPDKQTVKQLFDIVGKLFG